MPTSLDLTGLRNVIDRLRALENLDATEVMVKFELIIDNDNMRGVMAGQDKDGRPMTPVTYRPKSAIVTLHGPSAAARHPGYYKRGIFAGKGKHPSGLNNNLTSAEYRVLDGPPLAPRGKSSRVITNLYTEHHRDDAKPARWVAVGAWREVVSESGYEFLPVHFNGEPLGKNGPSIKRDLCGVRPEGMQEAQDAANEWIMTKLQGP